MNWKQVKAPNASHVSSPKVPGDETRDVFGIFSQLGLVEPDIREEKEIHGQKLLLDMIHIFSLE
jgi:hypothetical protein